MLRSIFLLMVAVAAFAQTTLWKVTYEGRTLYVGGTVHLLRPADYPLPAPFEKAFLAADVLVLETDIGAMGSPQAAMQIQEQLMYTPPASLRQALQPKTYTALEKYAVQSDLPMGMLDRMKPPMVAMTIMQVELQRLGMTAQGVDEYFYAQAVRSGKTVQWFESVQEQIAILADVGREDADGMIAQSLDEIGSYRSVMQQILTAWRSGNDEALSTLGKKYLLNDSPEEYHRLITKRNRHWMEKIVPMLQSPETELVLVGAMHLVGPDGLIALLKAKGCRVEKL